MTIFESGTFDLVAGFLCLGAAINYWMWSSLRVTFFKQEVFAIRDALWDSARKNGFLGDERYKMTRQRLNALIHASSLMNVEAAQLPPPGSAPSLPPASTDAIQNECDAALTAAGKEMQKFILFHHLSGLWAMLHGATAAQVKKLTVAMVRSPYPETIGAMKREAQLQ